MNPHRFRYLLIALVALAALWWAWPDADEPRQDPAPASVPGSAKSLRSPGPGRDAGPAHRGLLARKRPQPVVQTHPRIERVLGNESLSFVQAAEMMRGIALDRSLSLADRVDALEHGLNLDLQPFEDFASTPDLPPALAAVFLDEVMNANDTPALQLRTYMQLASHPDPDVAAEAMDMLAFVLGDDFNEQSLATLMEMGRKKLAELDQAASPDTP